MADPDLDQKGEGGGGSLDLLALLAFFPSVISSLLPKIKGVGGGGLSPRSATVININVTRMLVVGRKTTVKRYTKRSG